MAYNPVVGRTGIPQGNNPNSNINSGQGGDQFSMQNMQPEDYLGTLSNFDIDLQKELMLILI